MALKDWKKKIENDHMVFYRYNIKSNVNNTDYINIYNTPVPRGNNINRYVYSSVVNNKMFVKYFKTKQQALKFAKSYMRKH